MKVGFILGKKDKQIYDPAVYGNDQLKDIYSYNEERQGFQNTFDPPNKIIYNKMLFKFNGELKYFYVSDGIKKNDIEPLLGEYWGLSDTIGYDFD